MPLPSPTHPCWSRLAGGGIARLKTNQVGIQMLMTRLRASPATDAQKASEIRAFFEKYERILGPEISQLASM